MSGDLARCRELADMYIVGRDVPRDLGRGAQLYLKICDGGVAEACNTVGEIYEQVPGFEVSPSRVAELYRRACDGGVAAGCLNLGLFMSAAGNLEAGADLYDRACSAGLAAGCHHLAAAFEVGEGVQQNIPHAVELYDEACTADLYVDSCLALASLFTESTIVTPDPVRAASYNQRALQIYEQGCEAGNATDCTRRDNLRRLLAVQAAIGKQ